ncbi:MAG TPA: ADOP family duplicated permease [Thermoanaerobaculia bacterium]|nr:ADOP family duplicated permease [Thermoanaerobaculia bacterium]
MRRSDRPAPPTPPRLALWLLERLPADLAEHLTGDLLEELARRSATQPRRARLWFWRQTLGALLGQRRRASRERLPGRVAGGGEMLHGWLNDLRIGFRLLLRNPAVTLPVAATLAIGIGATVTMYSITRGLLRDLPVERPHEVVAIAPIDARLGTSGGVLVHAADVAALRRAQTSFRDVAAYRRGSFRVSEARGGDTSVEARRYDGAEIVPWTFVLLGVQPAIGRDFVPEDLLAGAPPVAIVSHSLWRELFAADPRALGRTLRVDGVEHAVVGVMPERFGFPTLQHVWLPLDLRQAELRGDADLDAFARLAPEVSLAKANAELAWLAPRLPSAESRAAGAADRLVVERYTERFIGSDAGPLLYTMLAVVSCVLLIACANVTNVLLARSVGRAREMAVRTAIGGGRARIVRQLSSEILWLAGLGGVLGAGLAWVAVDWFDRVLGHRIERFWVELAVDARALWFTAGLTLLATVLAGLAPVLQTLRADVSGALRDAVGSVSSFRLARTTRALVVAEVALACVLVVIASLMARGASWLGAREVGFDTRAVLAGTIDLNEADLPDAPAALAVMERLRQALVERPELGGVAFVSRAPGLETGAAPVLLEGEVYAEPEDRPRAQVRRTSPELFPLLGVAPARHARFDGGGRVLDGRDRAGAVEVAVVNVAFAERWLGGQSPVGRRIRLVDFEEGIWREIVGVVDDRGSTLAEGRPAPGVLVPFAQAPAFRFTVLGRLDVGEEGIGGEGAGEAAATAALRAAVAGVDPRLLIDELASVHQWIHDETTPQRTLGLLFAVFGAAGLSLAAVGVYGVLAFSVSRQTREIGLRRALGAPTEQILLRALRSAFWSLGLGVAIGMGLAMLVAPLFGQLLFGADPRDPVVLLSVPLVLALATALAATVPAARATAVDPLTALRAD